MVRGVFILIQCTSVIYYIRNYLILYPLIYSRFKYSKKNLFIFFFLTMDWEIGAKTVQYFFSQAWFLLSALQL